MQKFHKATKKANDFALKMGENFTATNRLTESPLDENKMAHRFGYVISWERFQSEFPLLLDSVQFMFYADVLCSMFHAN